MRPFHGCLAAALTLGLAACIPTPTTTPTPVPTTYQCTPEAGGAPYTCTESEHQEMVKKNALHAEAEQVYRAYTQEAVRLYREGVPVSDELLAMLNGDVAIEGRPANYFVTPWTPSA